MIHALFIICRSENERHARHLHGSPVIIATAIPMDVRQTYGQPTMVYAVGQPQMMHQAPPPPSGAPPPYTQSVAPSAPPYKG